MIHGSRRSIISSAGAVRLCLVFAFLMGCSPAEPQPNNTAVGSPEVEASGSTWLESSAVPAAPATAAVMSTRPQPTLSGRIAFDDFDDIFILDLPTGAIARLTHDPAREINPVWSPDGRRIAYRSNRDGHDDIFIMDSGGGHQRNLTATTDRDEWGPTWSPDGEWVAFNQSQAGRRAPLQIRIVHPDGTGGHDLHTAYAEFPDWSPDGRQIAFASMLPGGIGINPDYDIHTVDADGMHERSLERTPAIHEMYPRWSPDGSQIAFMAGPVGRDATSVWVMRADGSSRSQITSGNTALPCWSPDGTLIAFVELGPETDLNVVRPDGTGLIQLGLTQHLATLGFTAWTAR